ncbi:BamA/TamA family outer membrane protein [Spirosoma montaniterrae]|uniref:Bacterial surface antigen (D15) domain-containing protein n=1 Tax=Spirosoma montaniterrae TaxID=1178516 RepID=A0A1P9WSW9_9BACT|nr:BamA/TamA family outer membrane protein [Spirosoma montaniterrae]AQG78457.1 hypothetical protein AWR27_03345 [Spirosoma montaniterrae]
MARWQHRFLSLSRPQMAQLLIGLLLIGLGLTDCRAQYFGQNKIGYTTFQFKLHQTRNFELYHYLKNDSIRDFWARQSEIWYKTHRHVLGDSIPFRNPVILYNNHADFQQTNVTPGPIDPATGGFAEALKNRIVMPITKVNAQTDHVLGHEIVHALQFQMAQSGDSASIAGLFQLPLWFIEGMAEYLSIGPVDAHTALWMRDAVQANDLPTLNDLTANPRFFPYRWGHAFWAFTTGTWGEQVVRPLFLTAARQGVEPALQRVLGVSSAEFSRRWQASLRAQFVPFPSTPTNLSRVLNRNVLTSMQLAPALSPNGRYVAYLSEKNLFSIDVFLADARTGRVLRKLISTTRNSHLDALSYLESAGTWSPDSKQFGFVAFARGRNRLVVVDVSNGRIRREIEIPGVPAFSNPAWSPDNRYIAVNGLVDGQTDLYLYDLQDGSVRQLTNDRYSELQPSWSPDGRMLAYATDQPAKQDDRPLAFDHRLALFDVAANAPRILDIFPGADNLNPVFGTDNQTIYFLSDRDGYRNLYAHRPFGDETYQLTRFFTGISGITPHAPALSVSPETGQVVFSRFERQGYYMYRAEPLDLLWLPLTNKSVDHTAATLPPLPRFNQDFVAARLNSTRPNDPLRTEPVQAAPMRNQLRITGISGSGGGGAGVTANRFGTNLSGGVNATFSDMLGDRQLSVGLAVAGEITDVSGQITYLNRRKRINWGASLSHVPFRSGGVGSRLTTIDVGGQTVPVLERATDVQRTFEQQATLFSYLPLSRTRRVELAGAVSRYSFSTVRTSEFFFRGNLIGTDRQRLPSPADLYTAQLSAAYVGDNTTPGPVAPLKGHRYRVGAETSFGPLQMNTITADYRQYLRFRPLTLAFRGLHMGRYGRDAATGIIPPFFVGFPTLVRGYAAQTYASNPYRGDGDVSLNQMQGSSMAVANAELRLSLTGHERMALFRSRVFPTEIALFADAGYAWGRTGLEPDRLRLNAPSVSTTPVYSTGVSLRLNLLGFAVLEPFYAIPWQRSGGSQGVFGLNIAAGW